MERVSLLRRGTGEHVGRNYALWRLLLANIIDLVRLLRESWFLLLAFLILIFGTAAYLRFGYPHYLRALTTPQALYESTRLLIFQSSLDLPDKDILGTTLFFAAPVLGVLLLVRGVITLGHGFLDKRSRLVAWQVSLAATYNQHVIVVGVGRVGIRVVRRLLQAGHAPVVINANWDSPGVLQALRMKVPVIVGDARDAETLRQAQVGRARAIITTIDGDLTNIEIVLAARALHPDIRVVMRAFSDEMDDNLEHSLDPGKAFSSSGLASQTFFAAAISRDVDYVFPVGPGANVVATTEIEINPHSPLVGSVESLERAHDVRVLMVDRSALKTPGRGRVRAGARVMVLGTLERLEATRLANQPADAALPQHPDATWDTAIICGLGKVGFRVTQRLSVMANPPNIVVIDRNFEHEDLVAQVRQMKHVTLIKGDASDPAVLESAHLDRAYSLVALSSQDEENLRIGLAARSLRSDVHITLRVYSHTLAEKLPALFGIHTAYSTSELSSPTLAMAGLMGGIKRAFFIDETSYVIAERTFKAGDRFSDASLAQLRQRTGAQVTALRRSGALTLVPPLATRLEPGDNVTVLSLAQDIARLK